MINISLTDKDAEVILSSEGYVCDTITCVYDASIVDGYEELKPYNVKIAYPANNIPDAILVDPIRYDDVKDMLYDVVVERLFKNKLMAKLYG